MPETLTTPYGNPSSFDLSTYLSTVDEQLLTTAAGRRELTVLDPLLFAALYFPHHLKGEETGDEITFSEVHIDWCNMALDWLKPLVVNAQFRDAFVAPRNTGKSTWLFLLLPMWAAAHGHLRFVAAFADSSSQAEQHLMNFKHELETNALLRNDYPKLCRPLTGTWRAREIANSRGQIQQSTGFTFMARGIDSAVAGMKVGAIRPQVLILDDIEPDESNYSVHQMKKRLTTVLDNIFPLNSFARVLMVGTVTMPGSIMHQLVKSVTTTEKEQWIADEGIRVHYYPAIVADDDGTERSVWPQKWPLPYLQSIRHTRSYAKNFDNRPMPTDSAYWTSEDIRYATKENYGNTVMWIDPAVTKKQTSDYTAVAVVSRSSGNTPSDPLYVRESRQFRLTGEPLRQKILSLLTAFPDVGVVYVEANQGADLWLDVLHDLPVKVKTTHSSEPKDVRIQKALNAYQRNKVFHTQKFSLLEEQMTAYPNVIHDDLIDAVAGAVNYFNQPPKQVASAASGSYL